MIPIHEALSLIDATVQPLIAERAALMNGLNRVLAEPALAQTDLPPFDQSAVDGYAVRSEDVINAPLNLPLSGTIAATAQRSVPQLQARTAMRIYTGAMVPVSADTIVRQELTEARSGAIMIQQAVSTDTDLRHRGEELAAGTELAAAGQRLSAGLIGSLANGGLAKISVHPEPKIIVLITGDEVTAAGKGLKPGQVYDANGPTLAATLASWGYDKVRVRYVADNEPAVQKALKRAFHEANLIITTGGVSVGDLDYIPSVSEKLGAERVFWKVAQKPGMPLYFATRKGVPLLGLPGNPAAVLVNLHIYIRRILDLLEGLATPGPVWQSGVLAAKVRPDRRRDRWLRVAINQDSDHRTLLEPLTGQASHMLSNLASASGLAHIPSSDDELPAASPLRWIAM